MRKIQIMSSGIEILNEYFTGNGEIVAIIFPFLQNTMPNFTCPSSESHVHVLACYEISNKKISFIQFKEDSITRSVIESILEDEGVEFAFARKNCKKESTVIDIAGSLLKMVSYPFHRSDRKLILYSSIPKDSPYPRFSLEREEMLAKSIKSGNFLNTERLIDLTLKENTEDMILSDQMAEKLMDAIELMFLRFLSELEQSGEKDLIKTIANKIFKLRTYCKTSLYFDQVRLIANILSQYYKGIRNCHQNQLIESLKHYISSCLVQPDLSLQTLSSHFHLTREYISTVFHKGTGETFTEYVERHRTDKAKDLIISTNLSLKEIGHKCGFNTPITFRRTFKKKSGLSPSDYRMKNKGKPELDRSWIYIGKYASRDLIFAHTDPPDGLREKTAQVFAEKVRFYTNGYYSVRTYPESLLGYDTKLLELVSAGGVDFVVAGISIFAQYLKEMILFLSPFVVTSNKEGWEMMKDSTNIQHMFRELETSGFRILSCWERGFRCLTAKSEIRNPNDVKGLRIRVPPNPLHSVLWSNLGAEPIPLEINKVYEALKQDELDAQENPISTIWAQHFFEVAPYIILTRHMYSPLLMAASMKSWVDLSKEHQHGIERAAREAEEFSRLQLAEYEKRMLIDMERRGCTIIEPKIDPWRSAMRRGNDIFLQRFGLF